MPDAGCRLTPGDIQLNNIYTVHTSQHTVHLQLVVARQEWPYRKAFRIARGARTCSELFLAHISDGTHTGRGECGVLGHYGETVESVAAQIESMRDRLDTLHTPAALTAAMPAGSARNLLDCALWDLACRQQGRSVWSLAGVEPAEHLESDCTIGIDEPAGMLADARRLAAEGFRVLKVKAHDESVIDTVRTIASAAPGMRFIVDANEAWSLAQLKDVAPALADLGVSLIEQPLHRRDDHQLEGYDSPVALYADESCATSADLERLSARYDGINIKLDKAGGLTEALAMARSAKALGLGVMVGCNGATSLGLAPAYVLGALCAHRDLDSAALLHDDRPGGLRYAGSDVRVWTPGFWG